MASSEAAFLLLSKNRYFSKLKFAGNLNVQGSWVSVINKATGPYPEPGE
jgi:hypothetical protein